MGRARLKDVGYAVVVILLLALVVGVGFFPALQWYFPLKYRDEVFYHAALHELDPLLVTAVISVESDFNPRAVSPKGARGLMQIMPETAQWAATQMKLAEFDVERLFDPDVNVAIGVWYLATLTRQFDGDIVLALAAYNGGRANVLRWLNEEIWSGAREHAADIPFPETRGYVRKVLQRYDWYRFIWQREMRDRLGTPLELGGSSIKG